MRFFITIQSTCEFAPSQLIKLIRLATTKSTKLSTAWKIWFTIRPVSAPIINPVRIFLQLYSKLSIRNTRIYNVLLLPQPVSPVFFEFFIAVNVARTLSHSKGKIGSSPFSFTSVEVTGEVTLREPKTSRNVKPSQVKTPKISLTTMGTSFSK
jgi:hypothetical protein